VLYSNDTSVNSNHVVIDVNRSIVCNEIETSVTNVNFKYDFNMLNILYVKIKVDFTEFMQFASFSQKLISFKQSRLISKSTISSISKL
jgi:hypothetical protein